jgi:hypothetical protein
MAISTNALFQVETIVLAVGCCLMAVMLGAQTVRESGAA